MTEESESGMIGAAKNIAGVALVVGAAALAFHVAKKVVKKAKENKSNDIKWF